MKKNIQNLLLTAFLGVITLPVFADIPENPLVIETDLDLITMSPTCVDVSEKPEIMNENLPKDVEFMDAIEKNSIYSNSNNFHNFFKLTKEEQTELMDCVCLWACVHFADRGFTSLEQVVSHPKYAGYKCPNKSVCEQIFQSKQNYEKDESFRPSKESTILKEKNDSFLFGLQRKYNLSDHDAIEMCLYAKFLYLDSLQKQK